MTALASTLRFETSFAGLRGITLQRVALLAATAAALSVGAFGAAHSSLGIPSLAVGVAIFALAGYVKGLTAIGLPTIGVALLSFGMPIPEAMALVALPALSSNFWQAISGGNFLALLRRLAPVILPLCAMAVVTVLLLGRGAPGWALSVLAFVLMAYGTMGLLKLRPRVPARLEKPLAPVIGVASGFISGIAGVPIMPVLPFLQALDMKPQELVQSLGIVFCAASIAIGLTMTAAGVIELQHVALSVGALVPTLIGMALGQAARQRLSVEQFKTGIFVALLVIGLIALLR
jgi:uncharacterized membrane protein YfcA